MKFSELIGKKVISLYDKSIVGVVISANFNSAKSKVTSLIVEDSSDNGMFDELCLDVKSIYSSNFDAIVIKNNYCLKNLEEKMEFNPINFEVFTTLGKSKGKISDLILDEKYNIESLETKEGKIDIKNVAGVDNGIIIVQDAEQYVDISKCKHKIKKINVKNVTIKEENKAVILPLYNFNRQEEKEEENKQTTVKSVIHKTSNTNHLLGKIATQNIVAQNGELVCKIGSTITQEVINKANAYSKLRELSFYVK